MKDIGAEEQMSSWLFKQLKLHLEQEWKYQPREKGLSLIECTAEVRRSVSLGLGINCSYSLSCDDTSEDMAQSNGIFCST